LSYASLNQIGDKNGFGLTLLFDVLDSCSINRTLKELRLSITHPRQASVDALLSSFDWLLLSNKLPDLQSFALQIYVSDHSLDFSSMKEFNKNAAMVMINLLPYILPNLPQSLTNLNISSSLFNASVRTKLIHLLIDNLSWLPNLKSANTLLAHADGNSIAEMLCDERTDLVSSVLSTTCIGLERLH